MFEIIEIEKLAQKYNVELLTKVIFSFSPDIIMSPLALPRKLLNDWIDELMPNCNTQPMRDMLLQLQSRPTFAEQWPDTHHLGLVKGKQRVLQLENIRSATTTMAEILSTRTEILRWWNEIA